MRSIGFKIALGFAAVALVGVLIVAYLANRLTVAEFGNYLESGGLVQEQRVAEYLGERYASAGGWRGVASSLPPLSGWVGQRLIVADGAGRVVADSAGLLSDSPVPNPPPARSLPIVAGGKAVGTLYLAPDPRGGTGMMGGMMGSMRGPSASMIDMMRDLTDQAGSPERGFLDAVNRALWLAGGLAVGAALLLGLLISRQITAPLQRVTLAARRVAAGDFSQRVDVGSRDELAAMAEAFNTMAESLARTEEQRKRLLSDIAHELKTPLSIIQGNLEAMADGVVETTPERLASLQEETSLLSRLVTDLRDLSLAEAGHLRLHLERVDLAELVRVAVSGVRAQAEERGVHLEMDLPEGLPPVSADPDRVGQVLRNLLSNALRYTPPGGTVRVSASPSGNLPPSKETREQRARSFPLPLAGIRGDGTHHPPLSTQHSALVEVAVADTGSGIPAEDLPRIFDRFYRVDRSRARASGGTGLGLSVAKQLVDAHGGRIWAESEPGRGSTFRFTLRAAGTPVR